MNSKQPTEVLEGLLSAFTICAMSDFIKFVDDFVIEVTNVEGESAGKRMEEDSAKCKALIYGYLRSIMSEEEFDTFFVDVNKVS